MTEELKRLIRHRIRDLRLQSNSLHNEALEWERELANLERAEAEEAEREDPDR